MKSILLGSLATVLSLGSSAMAVSIPVPNFSFEVPDMSADPGSNIGQYSFAGATPWSTFGTVALFVPSKTTNGGFTAYRDQTLTDGLNLMGTQGALAQGANGSGVYQTLAETYVAGATYTLSVTLGGSYEAASDDPLGVIAFAHGDGGTVNFSGALLASASKAHPNALEFTDLSLSYVATAADAGKPIRILIGSLGTNQSAMFDAVTLSVVPEPGTFAMSTLGICTLASVVRRRRKA